jgi:hypothetical protein
MVNGITICPASLGMTMKARDFCFWLQGYFKILDPVKMSGTLDPKQVSVIQKHLRLVFKHEIDPSMGNDEHQEELNHIHKPNKPDKLPSDTIFRC